MRCTSTNLDKDRRKARNSVYRLLKFRLRSEKELRDKLRTKHISAKIIEETIAHFKTIHLVNDRQFTQAWVTARLAKPLGINRIRLELKTKGIAPELIKEHLTFDQTDYDEYDIVSSLALKRFEKYKGVEERKAKRRVFDYLVRRGFNPGAIIKAINKL